MRRAFRFGFGFTCGVLGALGASLLLLALELWREAWAWRRHQDRCDNVTYRVVAE
jgi:hypothetical protein